MDTASIDSGVDAIHISLQPDPDADAASGVHIGHQEAEDAVASVQWAARRVEDADDEGISVDAPQLHLTPPRPSKRRYLKANSISWNR